MGWSGDGVAVKRCCAKCRRGTPAFGETSCGLNSCPCHRPGLGSGSDSLGVQGDFQGSGVLGDSFVGSTAETADFWNGYSREEGKK